MADSLHRRPALWLLLAACLTILPLRPAWAFMDIFSGPLTVEKEKQLGEEFFLQLVPVVSLLEDPFISSYVNRLGQKLVAQLGPQPYKYRFFVINDPSMNAFAVPGGYVFVTTGMIRAMDREGELAGVLAHEISHIYARHLARQMENAKLTNLATIIGALASVFLGGALAQPLMMGTAAAGASAMLKYSRDHEREADSLGFKWMLKAGYNPRDMLSIFKKMGRQRWFEGSQLPVYLSTHPDVDNRLADLSHQLNVHKDSIPKEKNNPEFAYFAFKVDAACGNPNQMLRRVNQDLARDPKNPASYYGKGLALAKLEQADGAIAAFQEALRLSPGNPLVQRDLATVYFSRNRYVEAEKMFDELSRTNPYDEVILYYLGKIYQERRQVDKALPLFEKVLVINPTFTEVYHNLGTLYGEKKQLGPAHYYLGLHSLKARDYPTALFHFRKALENLPAGDARTAEARRQVARMEKMRVKVRP